MPEIVEIHSSACTRSHDLSQLHTSSDHDKENGHHNVDAKHHRLTHLHRSRPNSAAAPCSGVTKLPGHGQNEVQLKRLGRVPPKIFRSMSMSLNEGYSPPANFALVGCGGLVYRSSFPKIENFGYLKKLGLKSILTLVPEQYPMENKIFMEQNGITHFQIGMPGNKEPFVNIPDEKISAALNVILDRRNHPILIHCNKGKHRTGCVVGCLRKIQAWSLAVIFDEYRRYADPKSRALDQLKIEMYDEEACWEMSKKWDWIPQTIAAESCRHKRNISIAGRGVDNHGTAIEAK
ncbi:tyrosine-protein phosphatase siw14 [Rhizina undulata]